MPTTGNLIQPSTSNQQQQQQQRAATSAHVNLHAFHRFPHS